MLSSQLMGFGQETDPVIELRKVLQQPKAEALLRTLFENLSSPDFDTRNDAFNRLVASGPVALPMAKVYAAEAQGEAKQMAASLPGRILLEFDGYYPPSDELLAALERPVEMQVGDEETALAFLQRMAKEAGVELLFDQRHIPQDFALPTGSVTQGVSLKMLLENISGHTGLIPVVRGQTVILTAPEAARRLNRQRHSFDWTAFRFDQEEAKRIGEGLRTFFPGTITELHTGSEALVVRGPTGCIERAARMLDLLREGRRIWPAPSPEVDGAATARALAKPVSLDLRASGFESIVEAWRTQGLEIAYSNGTKRFEQAPFPAEVRRMAPVRLQLPELPAGLALRWLASRCAAVGPEAERVRLSGEPNEAGRLQVAIVANSRNALAGCVGGADLSFLPEALRRGTKEADEAAQELLCAKLGPHLALFPDFQIREDLRVLRGRMLVRGSPAAVACALHLIEQWKTKDAAPPCAWQEAMQAKLDARIDWDGRGLTAGKLLPRLRELGQLAILLVDAPDGTPAHFRLTLDEAKLLAPGNYAFRELLDDLARKAKAKWEERWGVVVLMPISQVQKENEMNAK